MSLEDDLKDKALGLISQQMANWVVEIQRQIGEHQGNLVRALDELQESVARYDERINEDEIAAGVRAVLASQPPAAPAAPVGPGMDQLKASVVQIEKGSSLSEVLTYLVDEVGRYVERTAMFIVKGTSAIGWYSRGVDPNDAVKQINLPLGADTIFRNVHNGKHAIRGHISHTPGTAQALARLGGRPQGMLAVPLILRDKLAAILYCDSSHEEVPPPNADLIEVLVLVAGKTIDILSLAPKTLPGARGTSGNTPERAAAIRAGGDEVRERAGVPAAAPAQRPTAPPPAAAPPRAPQQQEEGSSTVMFSTAQFQQAARQPAAHAAPAPPAAIRPEDQKAHDDAKRFGRLVVSEIKLYNEAKVNEGRRSRDLYERLKDDIERGRQMYNERVPAQVREHTNYFFDELVRILAGGDVGALGPM